MFHHFHSDTHPPVQGSISAKQFHEMLDWLSERYQLLNADVYAANLLSGTLKPNEICLSFDDALLCQSAIALPILRQRNIASFIFIYSSVFSGEPDLLEIYRRFRTTAFESIDIFYEAFFSHCRSIDPEQYELAEKTFDPENYLKDFPFYTLRDRWFRYFRDMILHTEAYDEVMASLMDFHNFSSADAADNLWMSERNLIEARDDGHILGLHSYSHPTMIQNFSYEKQKKEYQQNIDHLSGVLGSRPFSMSHPCGHYSDDTLTILREIGITVGFRSNMAVPEIRSTLEIPREDHANVLSRMRQ